MKKMLLTISMLLVAESNGMTLDYTDITKRLEQLAKSADTIRQDRKRIASESSTTSPITDDEALNFSVEQVPTAKDKRIEVEAEVLLSTLALVRRMVPNAGELAQKLDLRKLTDQQVLGAAIDAEQAREKAERAVNRAISSPSPKTSPRSPMSMSKRTPTPMRQVGPMTLELVKPVATKGPWVTPAIIEVTREEEGVFEFDSDDAV